MKLQPRVKTFPLVPWQVYLIYGAVLTIAYYLALPNPPVRAIVYTLIGISSVIAIGYSVLTNPLSKTWTWSVMGIGLFLYFLYDATYNFYRFFLNVPRPFPSIADVFFILSGAVLFIGLLQLAKAQVQRKNPFTLLDTFILAAGLFLLWWTVLMAPQAYNPTYTTLERVVATAYPLIDFLLASAGLRLALATAKRTPAVYMVGGALVGLLGADVVYAILQLKAVYMVGTWIDLGWIWFYILMGAAALYPRQTADVSQATSQAFTLSVQARTAIRLTLLTIAALLLPLSLSLSLLLRRGWQDPVLIAVGTVLILLVILRLYRLMQANIKLQLELARLKSDVLFRSIVERSYSGVSLFNPDLTAQYHSPNVYKIAAVSDINTDFRDLIHPDDKAKFSQFWVDTLSPTGSVPTLEYRLTNPDGGWSDVETISNNLLEDEWIHNVVVITRDISARKQYERRLRKMAYSDSLTGLPNRAALSEQLDEALARAKSNGRIAGVMFIDLDKFGAVNSNFGHTVGDQLLRELSKRLSARLYEGDTLARYGGDEFMIVSSNLQEPADAYLMHQRIASQLRRPFVLSGYQIHITACAGVALSEDGVSADELMRNADLTLQRAKSLGPGTMQVFTKQLLITNQRRHALSSQLRDILFSSEAAGAIHLAFQPIVNLADDTLARIEVSPQLHHPEFGNINMDELLAAAHGSDLLAELESRIFNQTCEILKAWKPLIKNHPLQTTVNISAASFSLPNFDRLIEETLRRHELSPSFIAMEITEKDLVSNDFAARLALESIANIGVEVIIDDFGREFSSITQLQRIPHAAIKLDSSLTQSIEDPDSALLVRGVIRIAHEFERSTIADGVSSEHQVKALRMLGCDYGQGEYFGHAIQTSEMEQRLRAMSRHIMRNAN